MFRYTNPLIRALKIKQIYRFNKIKNNNKTKSVKKEKEKEYENYKMIKRSWVIGDEEKIKTTWGVK